MSVDRDADVAVETRIIGNIAYQQGYIIDSERKIVQQLCAK